MTQIFIGNATRQNYEFSFRAPMRNPSGDGLPLRMHVIAPGAFKAIPGDWSPEEADSIILQHVPYGIIRDTDIDRGKEFHGIVYSLDKPITRTRLVYLMEHNLDELVTRGQEIRRANAVAQSDLVQKALEQNDRAERVTLFDATIQQEQEDPRNNVAQLSVGTLVRPGDNGNAPPRSSKAARRAAKRAA